MQGCPQLSVETPVVLRRSFIVLVRACGLTGLLFGPRFSCISLAARARSGARGTVKARRVRPAIRRNVLWSMSGMGVFKLSDQTSVVGRWSVHELGRARKFNPVLVLALQ